MSSLSIGASFSFPIDFQDAMSKTKRVLGRAYEVIPSDLCQMDKLIMYAKVVEAVNSVADVFFSTKIPFADNFKGALRTLKGWNALGGLPQQIKDTIDKMHGFLRAPGCFFRESIGAVTGLINKAYDAASFLENQIAIPFFKGVSEQYKSTHFSALGVGALNRLIQLIQLQSYSGLQISPCTFAIVENLSSVVLASSMLMGGGSQVTAAASALGAFAKGAGYCWVKIL